MNDGEWSVWGEWQGVVVTSTQFPNGAHSIIPYWGAPVAEWLQCKPYDPGSILTGDLCCMLSLSAPSVSCLPLNYQLLRGDGW